jgi:microcin C transport system permease protein
VLYGHVFRNAMLLVVAGIPQAFISVFFAGSLLIEVIFSLDGLGRMSYEAAVSATTRWCSARCSSSPCSAS